jgi:hypothetical protein
MRLVSLLLFASSSLATAAPSVPSQCGLSVTPASREGKGTRTGTLTKFERRKDDTSFVDATLDDGKGTLDLTFYLSPELVAAAPPLAALAKGTTLTITYSCAADFHRMCDARIDDAKGRTLVMASGTGADGIAPGWTSKVGKVLTSEQNTNTSEKSLRREHELELRHGKTIARVHEGTCVQVVDGGSTYLASGSAVSWVGQRPPEGVDWSAYSLVLQSAGP